MNDDDQWIKAQINTANRMIKAITPPKQGLFKKKAKKKT